MCLCLLGRGFRKKGGGDRASNEKRGQASSPPQKANLGKFTKKDGSFRFFGKEKKGGPDRFLEGGKEG